MKIAVVGGGISGLSSALILNPHHEVHLFESDSRLGGHARTVHVESGREKPVAVDTGFLVYNTLTYPHFTRFLNYLGVKTVASDMTLSIQTADGLEWGGTNLATVFAQKRNLFNPKFLFMLADILRFNRQAEENLELSRSNRWTLEDLVRYRGHGTAFQTLYLLPMTGAIWSMSYSNSLLFPAETFLTFCLNHHLLQVNDRPVWRTLEGGSIQYVERVRERLKHIHLTSPVQNARPLENGKVALHVNGQEVEFDKVVLATHAPVTRKILQSAFPELANELSAFKVTPNRVDLHEDSSVMPKNRICWSAWNVQARDSVQDETDISLTYDIGKLQPLASNRHHFVTLNSTRELQHVVRRFNYDHPQFDFAAIDAQKRLPSLQGRQSLYFAGAWTRYGFHEDGILSAVNATRAMGVEPPWV